MSMSKPKISHIVCMDRKGVIGYNNNMPWNIPEELEYFKQITLNSIVIMGNNTYKSIGKILPNRVNIIISSSEDTITEDNLYRVKSVEEAFVVAEYIASDELKDIFIIGGSSIYEQTFKFVDNLYISVININLEHHYNHSQFTDNFVYYLIPENIEDFELTSEQSLYSSHEVRSIKVLQYIRTKNKIDL